MRRAAVVALAALALPAAALAHVTVLPAFLADGERATLTFTAPNERATHVFTGMAVIAPAGIELTRVPPPAGWTLTVAGSTATWAGGDAKAGVEPQFRIAARTDLTPGSVSFRAVQRYEDGATVRWTVAFTVVPSPAAAPKQHLVPALVTAALGLVVMALLLVRLRGRQRRTLQEK